MRLGWALLPWVTVWAAAPPKVNFDREIRPIFSENCFQCHGPDAKSRMAGLRLDVKDGLATVVTPGDPRASKLFARLMHEKSAMRMPPAASGRTLTGAQIAKVKEWIEAGAEWAEHWAYARPKRPDVPAAQTPKWARNAADAFVLARLEKEGLKPSPEAERTTLLRRLSFDLTGLPPTPVEVDAFLKDKSADAYEKQVERLLASPHYGERMAMPWLDLARYADSHGFHIDSHRDMWHWREWVIGAFNRNLPYDRFIVEQLAGDLLPNATRDQVLATGFNRNHMINFEGGAIPEEYQNEYVVDRVEATSTAFLGTTMGCARCHDHKYDPIRQKDFYQMAAFFNTIAENGLDGRAGNAEPLLWLPTEEQDRRWTETLAGIDRCINTLFEPVVEEAQTAWEKAQAGKDAESPVRGLRSWFEFDTNLANRGAGFRTGRIRAGEVSYSNAPVNRGADFDGLTHVDLGEGVIDPGGAFTWTAHLRSSRQLERQGIVQMFSGANGFEIAATASDVLPRLRRGYFLEVRWTRGDGRELAVRTREHLRNGDPYHVAVLHDGSLRAAGVRIAVNGQPVETVTVADTLGGPFALKAPLEIGNEKLGFRFRGRLDDMRVYDRLLEPGEMEQLAFHYPVAWLLHNVASDRRSRDQQRQVRKYFLDREAPQELRQAFAEWGRWEKEYEDLVWETPSTMVMREMSGKPRETFVLGRGDYQNKGEKVSPETPSMLPPMKAGAPRNRLGLAEWIASEDNPLTARVAVNRLWQNLFGIGLVKTSEDFGSQGEAPSHPELLDWLATEFVRTGWDVKAMVRLMVTSATYRQSSRVTPALHERDPENRLLARGPRQRLMAELVRDNALAVSGLLKDTIGGESVLPYQPAGLWEELAFGDVYSRQTYVQDHGDKLYRRSMYTFWKRTSPPASLTTFDAPDREKCSGRRATTNTPLQALVVLNDATYVEAARALATRTWKEAPRTSDARLRHAFRLATAREPDTREMLVLRRALERQLAEYAGNEKAAQALLQVGESPYDKSIPAPQLAAWTNVCSIILNLDETLTKE